MPLVEMVWKKLLEDLRSTVGRPARIHHREDGRTTCVWHVDNDDDRYVLLEDSASSRDLLVVNRDGRWVEAVVVGTASEASLVVADKVSILAEAKRSSA